MPCYGAVLFLTVSLKEEEPVAARLFDGKALALQVRERLATESAAVLAKTGMKPGLAKIMVGDEPASQLYL
jgi:methylenetetrahydrofolate dehydrogenase (NADP+)/methenyltetrahydrofolate cyclohydrolase